MVGRSNIIGELVRAGESSCPALLEAAGYRALVWLPVLTNVQVRLLVCPFHDGFFGILAIVADGKPLSTV
jgi:hypothetical protein